MEAVVAVLIVLLASALCSGTEAALLSVPVSRARQLAEGGSASARALGEARGNVTRPLATIVVLNNVANIVGSMMVGALALSVLGSAWLGAFSALLTFLVIVFAEIFPKTVGERYAERISLFLARPLALLSRALAPAHWCIERMTSFLRSGRDHITNEGEIAFLARAGGEEGAIEEDEAELIRRVFEMKGSRARDIMTPRVALTALPGSATLGNAETLDFVKASPHTRIVVYGQDLDDVLGVIRKSRLLTARVEGKVDVPVAELADPVHTVLVHMRADDLLREFLRGRRHLAIVRGEYGGVAGVVTLEDVLEILTGEIVDETDRVTNLQELARSRSPLAAD